MQHNITGWPMAKPVRIDQLIEVLGRPSEAASLAAANAVLYSPNRRVVMIQVESARGGGSTITVPFGNRALDSFQLERPEDLEILVHFLEERTQQPFIEDPSDQGCRRRMDRFQQLEMFRRLRTSPAPEPPSRERGRRLFARLSMGQAR